MKLHEQIAVEKEIDEALGDYVRAAKAKVGAVASKIAGAFKAKPKDDAPTKGGNAQIVKELTTLSNNLLRQIQQAGQVLAQKLKRQNADSEETKAELGELMHNQAEAFVAKYRRGAAIEVQYTVDPKDPNDEPTVFFWEKESLVKKQREPLFEIWLGNGKFSIKFDTDFAQRIVNLQRLMDAGSTRTRQAAPTQQTTQQQSSSNNQPTQNTNTNQQTPPPANTAVVNPNEMAKKLAADWKAYQAGGNPASKSLKNQIARMAKQAGVVIPPPKP